MNIIMITTMIMITMIIQFSIVQAIVNFLEWMVCPSINFKENNQFGEEKKRKNQQIFFEFGKFEEIFFLSVWNVKIYGEVVALKLDIWYERLLQRTSHRFRRFYIISKQYHSQPKKLSKTLNKSEFLRMEYIIHMVMLLSPLVFSFGQLKWVSEQFEDL